MNEPEVLAVEVVSQDVSAVARDEREAMMELAKKYPRKEMEAAALICRSCERVGLAEKAEYRFTRGGQVIRGATINLAREAARVWGNILSGQRTTSEDGSYATVQGWALDLQSGRGTQLEKKVKILVQRKGGGATQWVKPNERDKLELIGREGSKLERNAILALIPSDIVADAVDVARRTLESAASGDLKKNREDVIRGLVAVAMSVGIYQADIEKHIDHPVEQLSGEEVVDIRKLINAIKAKEVTVAEAFPRESDKEVTEALKKKAKKKAPPKEEEDLSPSEDDSGNADGLDFGLPERED